MLQPPILLLHIVLQCQKIGKDEGEMVERRGLEERRKRGRQTGWAVGGGSTEWRGSGGMAFACTERRHAAKKQTQKQETQSNNNHNPTRNRTTRQVPLAQSRPFRMVCGLPNGPASLRLLFDLCRLRVACVFEHFAFLVLHSPLACLPRPPLTSARLPRPPSHPACLPRPPLTSAFPACSPVLLSPLPRLPRPPLCFFCLSLVLHSSPLCFFFSLPLSSLPPLTLPPSPPLTSACLCLPSSSSTLLCLPPSSSPSPLLASLVFHSPLLASLVPPLTSACLPRPPLSSACLPRLPLTSACLPRPSSHLCFASLVLHSPLLASLVPLTSACLARPPLTSLR
ncbi:hypothetical protein BLNAU_926 [Blattamonas nauphoetae]|uniref:Uncharacterized protein n=1 Tax=Blattamonas nauphoetae TaxID=2049346 RepID=A0ABQ9YKW2_9EUKA|nr:hypothetical protein BLNAU_926 [Blattamonas nauphoetae]